MPNYFYTAKSIDGETKKGKLAARDLHDLSRQLKDNELILVEATDCEAKKNNLNFSLPPIFSRVSAVEKIMMAKNLQVMAATGLSIIKSLEVLSAQTKNVKLKKALADIKERVNKGESFSEAISNYPDIFSDFFVSMAKVGEESGTMENVLKVLSMQLEKEHKLKSKMQAAMIYPCIILLVMVAVGIIIVTFVLPSLNTFFSSMATEVPFYTKMLLSFGEFSTKYWPFIIGFFAFLSGAFWMALRSRPGKAIADAVLLKLPLFSPLVKKSNCAVLIRSLSSLLSAGVPFTRSLEVTAGTVGNHFFKEALNESLEKIKKGEKLSKTLSAHGNIFPFGVIEMIEVGEETGKTSTILSELADFYEQETIAATEKLSSSIEPILIVVLGVAVAIFAFSIIEPMYSMLGSIQ